MERLEKKRIKGHEYYYYSIWERVNGKCRRVKQVYLGKLQDILERATGEAPKEAYAEVFTRGLSMALWSEACKMNTVKIIDEQCPKRIQGLSIGHYITLAALNRASDPKSKRSMWEWFAKTSLTRALPAISKDMLTSQRFWDHMDRINEKEITAIWQNLIKTVVNKEDINLSTIHLDGTNFYTFIDTFNTRCEMPKHGKNKQKRDDLRQVNYSIFCSEKHQIPLFFDVYDGNRNDYTQVPLAIEKFTSHLKIINSDSNRPSITLIFDKGNNSDANMKLLDEQGLHFVTSVRNEEVKALAYISNKSEELKPCTDVDLYGTSAYRITHKVLGANRTVVVTYSQMLFEREWKTVHQNVGKAIVKLKAIQQRLQDRFSGVISKGAGSTKEQIVEQCIKLLNKPYLKAFITITTTDVTIESAGKKKTVPKLEYNLDREALETYCSTSLGKTILMTTRHEWDTEKIIKSYRSLFVIENVFKEMKNRQNGSWWPMYHWTDSKIKVHALYCTIALLFRSLLIKRVKDSGLQISANRLLQELEDIKEVVNVIPPKSNQRKISSHAVLSKLNDLQQQLVSILHLELNKTS